MRIAMEPGVSKQALAYENVRPNPANRPAGAIDDGLEPLAIGFGEMLANDWLIAGQFIYPKEAPARLAQLTASRQLRLDAVRPRTYSLDRSAEGYGAGFRARGGGTRTPNDQQTGDQLPGRARPSEGPEMSTSLYDMSVANYIQTVTAVTGFLDKGLAHCTSKSIEPAEFVEAKLFADMLPLRFQVVSVAHHSLGAVEALKKGVFAPPHQTAPLDYHGLQKLIADTAEGLRRIRPEEVNTLQGRDVTFQMRDRQIPFTAEGFILSFSLPNFYFHATTAYDILRTKGVPLGKRDFLGQLRLKS